MTVLRENSCQLPPPAKVHPFRWDEISTNFSPSGRRKEKVYPTAARAHATGPPIPHNPHPHQSHSLQACASPAWNGCWSYRLVTWCSVFSIQQDPLSGGSENQALSGNQVPF
ncbi:hypothetical protein ZHAS_00002614 [Anopheles sinensis]|uniref:Uncharacterized protein n=1 Tax=Anopheles sinensis TaxID=74873 RepID=A0A084VCM1_ANOSI|nr:hypothetical protein ZHAS_00002614 [Anopheles sinensis]